MPYANERYCLVGWRQTPEGLKPDLPEGTFWQLLADPPGFSWPSEDTNQNNNYSLFLVRWPQDTPWPPEIEFVPEYLVALLDSAIYEYPPALAVSRQKIARHEEMSRSEFMETFARCLRFYLDRQPASPFFLAKAIKQESGYKHTGSYYWIVGMGTGENPYVSWVSSDFFIYRSSATDFAVERAWLEKRFKMK